MKVSSKRWRSDSEKRERRAKWSPCANCGFRAPVADLVGCLCADCAEMVAAIRRQFEEARRGRRSGL